MGKKLILAAIEAGDITVDDAISNLPNEEDGKADEALKKEDKANKGNKDYKKFENPTNGQRMIFLLLILN